MECTTTLPSQQPSMIQCTTTATTATANANEPPPKLLGSWACSHTHRVHVALKLKGLDFEYLEEDHLEKSSLLSTYNPIYKKVPMLVHNGRPIVNSAVILEYVDEVWPENRIVPDDPFERATVRFWCHFFDNKVGPRMAMTFQTMGEEQKAAVVEVHENLSLIERELREGFFKERRFFGGERINLLDIVIGCGSYWLPVFEEVAGVKVVDPQAFPQFTKWLHGFEEESMVKEMIPAHEKLAEYAKGLRGMILGGLDLGAGTEDVGKVVADAVVSENGGN